MLFKSVILALAALATAFPANTCGPKYGNQVCAAGKCCSQYGYCDTGAAYCDAKTCLSKYSGAGSSCYKLTHHTTTTTKKATSTKSSAPSNTGFKGPYASKVPEIDVCGAGSGSQDVSCPGAGINGYFYRCCSSHGHCGPKNNIQDQAIYCGVQEAGCQSKYGSCNDTVPLPPNPTGTPGIAQKGETCGPIVNKKCAGSLCCSGSNFCGTGADYCGAANWCQKNWGGPCSN